MQGRCPQNRKAISNTNFLEIATNTLSIDENSSSDAKYAGRKDIKNSEESTEGDCLYVWMISDLKCKCLTTLLSLLKFKLILCHNLYAKSLQFTGMKRKFSQYL